MAESHFPRCQPAFILLHWFGWERKEDALWWVVLTCGEWKAQIKVKMRAYPVPLLNGRLVTGCVLAQWMAAPEVVVTAGCAHPSSLWLGMPGAAPEQCGHDPESHRCWVRLHYRAVTCLFTHWFRAVSALCQFPSLLPSASRLDVNPLRPRLSCVHLCM